MLCRFRFISSNIHDLTIIIKGGLCDHLDELELTLHQIKYNLLKCIIDQDLFIQIEMGYLVF